MCNGRHALYEHLSIENVQNFDSTYLDNETSHGFRSFLKCIKGSDILGC